MKKKIYDVLLVGSGLSSIIFAKEYLKKNSSINIISPDFKKYTNSTSGSLSNYKALPPQFKKNFKKIDDYFHFNKFKFNKKNCNLLGSLEFGGLSNYWGLQMDRNIDDDIKHLSKNTQKDIKNCFLEILKENLLLGNYETFNNNFKIDYFYENLITCIKKNDTHIFEKPIIAISSKIKKINKINRNCIKLTPNDIFKNLDKKKVIFHNYYVDTITKKNDLILVKCKNLQQEKSFFTKKIVLASGTLVTTKLLMDYFKIKKTIPIKHHPRLISVYIARNKLLSNLDMTPGLLQIKKNTNNKNYVGDLRPSNEIILNMALKIFSFLKPLKFIFLLFKDKILFSNNLLGSKYSNLYMKKNKDKFSIFSKNKKTLLVLKQKQKNIYKFLKEKKLIFSLYKNFFPGIGADYHYFGTVPIKRSGKLSLNEKCQVNQNKSIYVIDGSAFDFKKNLYPLGTIIANSKRVAKLIK